MLSLCLSRACLGKTVAFMTYKWLNTTVFAYSAPGGFRAADEDVDLLLDLAAAGVSCRKCAFPSAFSMFVPSPSWQYDRFYSIVKLAQKRRFPHHSKGSLHPCHTPRRSSRPSTAGAGAAGAQRG
eukprot:COSAG06_NODE_685_length_13103_cov_126.328668_14_plen_125_part_00